MLDPADLAAAEAHRRRSLWQRSLPLARGSRPTYLKASAEGGKPDFFGAKPADATFVSTSVVPGADGKSAAVTGNLTLNGVTKPVTLAAKFSGAGTNMMSGAATVGFHGEATIKRSDFGMGFLVPIVGDEVALTITIAFEEEVARSPGQQQPEPSPRSGEGGWGCADACRTAPRLTASLPHQGKGRPKLLYEGFGLLPRSKMPALLHLRPSARC